MEPHFGFSNHKEEILVGDIPLYFRFATLLSEPCECGHTIGINDPIEVVFLDVSESENEREELSDVVGSLPEWSTMEYFGTGIDNDSPELHDTRVTATRGVDRQRR
jgi:hypothetical protein